MRSAASTGARCLTVALVGAGLAGCGSLTRSELPPPAGPAPSPPLAQDPAGEVIAARVGALEAPDRLRARTEDGSRGARLDPRARTLTVTSVRGTEAVLDVGAGPTAVVAEADRFYVVDAVGEGLLVVQTRPQARVTRRVALLGGPYAATVEPLGNDLWVTLTATNEIVRLPAHSRPFVMERLPAVRAPREVLADSGVVLVRGADATQVLPARRPGGQPGA